MWRDIGKELQEPVRRHLPVKGAEKTEAVNSTAVHKRAMLRRQAAFKKIDVCFMINPPFVEQ